MRDELPKRPNWMARAAAVSAKRGADPLPKGDVTPPALPMSREGIPVWGHEDEEVRK